MSNSIINFLRYLGFDTIEENENFVYMKKSYSLNNEIYVKIGWKKVCVETSLFPSKFVTTINFPIEKTLAKIALYLSDCNYEYRHKINRFYDSVCDD